MTKHNKHWMATHNQLQEIVFSLLKTRPAEEITVSLVCEIAHINRSTFYAHYLDVYDLLDKTQQAKRTTMFTAFQKQARRQRLTFFDQRSLTLFLKFIKRYGWFYKIILQSRTSFPIKEGYDRLSELILTPLKKRQPELTSEDLLYQFIAFQAGFTMILRHWAENGYVTDPDRLAMLLIEALPASIRTALSTAYQEPNTQNHDDNTNAKPK